jgi:cytochrome b involved in lipid metabolism
MLRKIFIVSTLIFWLIVAGFWLADFLAPPKPVAPVFAGAGSVEKNYSQTEISSHNREDDCWLIIEGHVYDITPYLPDHPTEPEIIQPWCGKEATQAWLTKNKDRPHSPRAGQLLEKYRIGKGAE